MKFLAYHEKLQRGTFDFPVEFYYVDSKFPRYDMPFHWHMQYELLLIIEGSFKITLDDKIIVLNAGESVLIPDGTIHGGVPYNCVYKCIVFDLVSFLRNNTLYKSEIEKITNNEIDIKLYYEDNTEETKVIHQLFECIEKKDKYYEIFAIGLLWQFIGTLLTNNDLNKPQESNKKDQKYLNKIKAVLRLIREDYAKPLTLSDLANASNLSPKYLCRAFVQTTGRSPINYLNYYRIECAAERLLNTSDSITDIALMCGFNDLSYFIKTFKKQKELSPSRYRNERKIYNYPSFYKKEHIITL